MLRAIVLFAVLSCASSSPAEESPPAPTHCLSGAGTIRIAPSAHELDRLGKVHFPVSCSAAAQKEFERAVAILHSFWYEESERAFGAAIAADPSCAMGYWGI